MAACLITGGAGFIGSHLVDALVARGDRVRVLDNFSAGAHANLAKSGAAIELIAADLNVNGALQKAMRGVDFVFHFMEPACPAAKDAESAPWKWASATDTLNVLMAARAAGVRRVIFPSSGAVYGQGGNTPFKESDQIAPNSPCGFAKQTAENQCAGFTLLYGLETVRLRFFNVFGPRQSPTTPYAAAVPGILRAMLGGSSPVIRESPFEQLDLLYIADAVHAILLAAEATRAAGKVFNIARGRTASLVQVVTAANQVLGTHLQPVFADCRPPTIPTPGADISRAEAELGFCPSTDLRQGLARFLDHLQHHSHPTPMQMALDIGHLQTKDPHFLQRDRPPSLSASPEPVE